MIGLVGHTLSMAGGMVSGQLMRGIGGIGELGIPRGDYPSLISTYRVVSSPAAVSSCSRRGQSCQQRVQPGAMQCMHPPQTVSGSHRACSLIGLTH